MNLLLTPIAAVLIGLLVRSRLTAVCLYLAIEAVFFTFQTLVVLLAWMSGQGGFGGATDQGAFGPAPTGFPIVFADGDVWAYGLLNVAVMLVGIGVILGVSALLERRRRRLPAPAPA